MTSKRKIKRFVSKAVREIIWNRKYSGEDSIPQMPKSWTPTKYRRSYSLGSQLGFDSLDILELTSTIESEYNIKLGQGSNYYQSKGDYYSKTQEEIVRETYQLVKTKEKSLESRMQTSFIPNPSNA